MRKTTAIFVMVILNVAHAYSAPIISNTPNGCDFTNAQAWMFADFVRNQYQCNAGEYLPADAIACEQCPSGWTCIGGTYTFNETDNQGLSSYTFPVSTTVKWGCVNNVLAPQNNQSALYAVFERNQYTCSAGTYLPADSDGCQPCPANSYCVGGTYTFNENASAGAVACGAGLFAPAGSSSSSQCTRVLRVGDKHIYLRPTPQTVPSLNIDIDNDGVADYFANMTTLEVPMSAEYAELQSGNHLVIDIAEDYTVNEQLVFPAGLYYVYDDTVTPTE